jgi:hypothetical protein
MPKLPTSSALPWQAQADSEVVAVQSIGPARYALRESSTTNGLKVNNGEVEVSGDEERQDDEVDEDDAGDEDDGTFKPKDALPRPQTTLRNIKQLVSQ